MNKTMSMSRILWIVAGVLLMVAGVLCLLNLDLALTAAALYLGISMLISAIVDIVIFAKASDALKGAGWILANGIFTLLFALFLLFHRTLTMLSLPYIFGMWLLLSGVSQFVNAFELRRLTIRGWGWILAMGILLALVGFFSLFDPVSNLFAIGSLVGILLILEGLSNILRGCMSKRFWI